MRRSLAEALASASDLIGDYAEQERHYQTALVAAKRAGDNWIEAKMYSTPMPACKSGNRHDTTMHGRAHEQRCVYSALSMTRPEWSRPWVR